MLKPTSSHKDLINKKHNSYTLKIGDKVPDNAVSLAYFYNKGSDMISKNILSVQSAKNSIDHIEMVEYRSVSDQTNKNDNLFDAQLDYNDEDGYVGVLYRVGVEWFEKNKEDVKFCAIQKTYTNLTQKKVPSSIEHKEGPMNGTLFLTKENYIPTDWEIRQNSNTYTKKKVQMVTKQGLESPSYNFPKYIEANDDGYTGKLYIDNSSIEYIEVNNDSNVKLVTITKEYVGINPSYPSSIDYEYNGKIYKIPVVNTYSSTIEVKHYGATRYWGYSTTGLYGTKDRKYAATSAGGKGYFSKDVYPAQIPNRYGHFPNDLIMKYKNITIKSSYTGNREIDISNAERLYLDEQVVKVDGKPYSLGDKYSSYYNFDTVTNAPGVEKDIFEGTEWTYDLDKAASYGSPNNLKHGGCIWASQYLAKTNVFPPVGYEDDRVWNGDKHMILVTDEFLVKDGKKYYTNDNIIIEGKTYKAGNIIKINNYAKNRVQYGDFVLKRNCLFTGVTRCTKELSYPGNQQYSKMTMMFYKGKTRSTKVTYSASIIIGQGKTYTARANYIGDLKKVVSTEEIVPVKWDCNAFYEGEIKNFYNLYDGLATFRGIALKRNSIGNLTPSQPNEVVMYPNEDGVLVSDLDNESSFEIEGKNFLITDVYHNKTPLFNSYTLNEYIYDLEGPNKAGLYDGNSIVLLDNNNVELPYPYLYKIKLIPTKYKNLYEGVVFTSFDTTTNNPIYCVYNSCSHNELGADISTFKSGKKELIFVQPAYQPNKDYKVVSLDGYRKSKIKVYDYVSFKDCRKKIPITYVVKTSDNKYVSKPINANIINKQYAFESEMSKFIGNGYIISPMYDKVTLTACDILIRDLDIQSWNLNGKQIVVELFKTDSSYTNSDKVYLYTDQDGSGYILGETTEETGFLNTETNEYDLSYKFDSMYTMHNNYVSSAFTIVNKDINSINLVSPKQSHSLSSWYANISFGNFSQVFEQYNARTKVTYSIPEFSKQYFNGIDGEPYKRVEDEIAEIIDSNSIKITKTPMYVKYNSKNEITNLFVYKKNILGNNQSVTIESWSHKEGVIRILETINDTDKLYVTYEYEEENYVYRGYYNNNEFIDLDLNPNMYHDYLDTSSVPYKRLNTYKLFGKSIYFFIKPKKVEDVELKKVFIDNNEVIYHKFDDATPNGEYDLLIGKMLVRHNTSLKSTEMIDTRQLGGGVLDTIQDKLRKELEPESEYYFDIGNYDGAMYAENATIIIRLNSNMLLDNGGKLTRKYISEIVDKWKAFGVNSIIEYVDAIEDVDVVSDIKFNKLN